MFTVSFLEKNLFPWKCLGDSNVPKVAVDLVVRLMKLMDFVSGYVYGNPPLTKWDQNFCC